MHSEVHVRGVLLPGLLWLNLSTKGASSSETCPGVIRDGSGPQVRYDGTDADEHRVGRWVVQGSGSASVDAVGEPAPNTGPATGERLGAASIGVLCAAHRPGAGHSRRRVQSSSLGSGGSAEAVRGLL